MERWILAVATIVAMLIPTKHALHMFQQNRYEIGRYSKWLVGNKKMIQDMLVTTLCYIVVAGLLTYFAGYKIFAWVWLVLLLLVTGINVIREKNKKYIKPLVYTGRVKRQIIVMALLQIGLILLNHEFLPQYACISTLVIILPWILIFFVGWITSPIETFVKQWFIGQAKKILREDKDLIKIGITGSYGKTSTKNVMQAMIGEQFNTLMTPASYNTPMGITITIRTLLKPIHKVFVCEMGADHVGEITYLMKFVQPSIGVVTSIGPQHLATFGSQENIIKEKMQMMELLPKKGLGVLNYDNDFIRNYRLKNPVKTVSYGVKSRDVDYYADDITYTRMGSSFTVVHRDERVRIETKLLGELNILNILSAICVARHLNVPWSTIQRAAKTMKQVEHRLELKTINGYRFIDDAFNSNPVGSAMALEVLSMMPNTRYVVTPGMIDLGAIQDDANKEFGRKMKGKADEVILVGEIQTKPIYEGLEEVGFDMNRVIVVKTVKEAFAHIYRHALPTDTILLENDLPDAFSH